VCHKRTWGLDNACRCHKRAPCCPSKHKKSTWRDRVIPGGITRRDHAGTAGLQTGKTVKACLQRRVCRQARRIKIQPTFGCRPASRDQNQSRHACIHMRMHASIHMRMQPKSACMHTRTGFDNRDQHQSRDACIHMRVSMHAWTQSGCMHTHACVGICVGEYSVP
jgi:hypothetical protein